MTLNNIQMHFVIQIQILANAYNLHDQKSVRKTLKSSAFEKLFEQLMQSDLSLMKMVKSNGPMLLPCGTLDVTGKEEKNSNLF